MADRAVIFFVLVCLPLLVAGQQKLCTVDGTSYVCPTIASSLDRWGLEFRRYAPSAYAMNFHSAASPLLAFQNGLPVVIDYLNGNNLNQTKIPLSRPAVAASLVGGFVPFLFLPDQYVKQPSSAPLPDINSTISTGVWTEDEYIVMQIPQNLTAAVISTSLSKIQSICRDHQQSYQARVYFVISYLTNDLLTWPNEIWLLPLANTEQQTQQ